MRIVKLGEILTESKVESINPDPNRRITVRLFLKGIEKRPFEAGIDGATKYYTRKAGQFIYGKQNLFKGAFGIVPKELDGFDSSSDIPCFDVSEQCLPEWLYYFLKQGRFYESLEKIATGTGSRRIQPSRLFEVKIPLPSLPEQRKIIEVTKKIENEFEVLDSEFQLQSNYISKLRQSILQEAVQGKLVPQNPKNEHACILLEKIKAENQKLVAEGKLKKEKELPPITKDEIPFELPKGWVWCRFQEISKVDSGSTPDQKEFTQNPDDIPYLKVYNISKQKVAFEYKPQYIRRSCHEGQLKRSICVAGNVIMNIVGPPLGKIAIIPSDIPECNINQAIAVFRPYNVDLSLWFYYYLCEMSAINSIVTKGTAGQDNISLTQARELIIALPPLQEQQRIVSKVEELMKLCDQLEQEVKQSKQTTEQLMQSVLREAFEGEEKKILTAHVTNYNL